MTGATPPNFSIAEAGETARSSYKTAYDRLGEIRAKYDPNNDFRLNHNIVPSPSERS